MNSAVPSMYRNAVKELMESKAMRRLAGFQNRERQLLPAGSEPDYAPQKHSSPFSLGYMTTTNASYPSCTADAHTCGVHMKPRSCWRQPTTWAQPWSAIPTEIPLTFHLASVPSLLSHFNSKKGGYLVLRELGLVMEFLPGAMVLILSAVLTHYNSMIQEGATRYSFTQYAAGSLFSYIYNGMKSDREVVQDPDFEANEALRHSAAQ